VPSFALTAPQRRLLAALAACVLAAALVFRHHAAGGATELFGVVPDVVCLAKAICGGLPGRGGVSRGPGAAEMIFKDPSSEEGVAFKEEFNKRKEELSTLLDKARDAFTNCGYELKRMSREHYNTEHDNKADAEKIRGFVTDGLAHDYQSASVLVPPPPGGYPPPAPGAAPSNNGSASK